MGFATENYYGYDFVSCYWGDDEANLICGLNADERAYFENLRGTMLTLNKLANDFKRAKLYELFNQLRQEQKERFHVKALDARSAS